MKLKRSLNLLITSTLTGSILLGNAYVGGISTFAKDVVESKGVEQKVDYPKNGLQLKMYYDFEMKETAMIVPMCEPSEINILDLAKDTFPEGKQSISIALWRGIIKPDNSVEYIFSTNQDKEVDIYINGEKVLGNDIDKPIKLIHGESYNIEIHQTIDENDLKPMQLFWKYGKNNIEKVPDNVLYGPDVVEEAQKRME